MDYLTGGAKGGGGGPTGPVPPGAASFGSYPTGMPVFGPVPGVQQTPGMPGVPGLGAPLPPAQMPQFGVPNLTTPGAPGGGTPWYMNPQIWGLIGNGAAGVWGAVNQNQTNNANTAAQQAQLAMLNARQAQITGYVNQFLQPGQNQYSAAILQMLGAQGQAPAAPGTQPQTPVQSPQVPQVSDTNPPAIGQPGWSIFNINRPASNSLVPGGATDVGGSIPSSAQPQIGAAQAGAAGFSLPAFQAPGQITPGTYNPTGIDLGAFSAGTPGFNAGQDSLMQMLRAGPQLGTANAGVNSVIQGQGNPYDTTGLFKAIDASGQNALDQQVAQLQGSFGSFGQRLGSAAMNAQGQLRNNYLLGSNLQKQQIGQQAYGDAQARLMAALGLSSQNALGAYGAQAGVAQGLGGLGLNQLQLLSQLAQANQGAYNQGAQFNINNSLAAQQSNQAAGQQWNQFQLGALGQANAIQQAQSGQNINLLSLLAGLPMGQAPVAQPNALPGAIGDLSQLALLYPYLQRRA